ncbi:MAG TPA: hypothetical protein VD816_05005, partial [Ohtaekwangia sp.]|nr:hypothetical protein [Ohtaekwangia sp.]
GSPVTGYPPGQGRRGKGKKKAGQCDLLHKVGLMEIKFPEFPLMPDYPFINFNLYLSLKGVICLNG